MDINSSYIDPNDPLLQQPSLATGQFKSSGWDPFGVNGQKNSPAKLLEKLNQLAGKNGIGRVDLVENRFIGISLEVYTKHLGVLC